MSYYNLGPVSGNKKRTLGLTTQKPFAGNLLIMHKLPSNTLDDVSHNPISSSDEFLSDLSDGAFEALPPASKKNRIPERASASTSERERHTLTGSPRDELECHKSNIPSTSFISGGRSSRIPGSQPFKRPFQAVKDGADEDERAEEWASKKSRPRKFYGAGIRGSQAVTEEKPRKKTNGASRSKRKTRDSEGLFLQCESGGTVATMDDLS